MFTSSHFSRRIALVAAPTLALGALAATPAPSYAAADPTPTANGGAWLVGELTDGLLVGDFGPDTGLTIDTAVALKAAGGFDSSIQSIADAVAADVDASNPNYNYVSGEAFDDVGSTYAGAVAKTVVMAQTAGRETDTFGGEDFVHRLESVVSEDIASAGRIVDVSSYGDNANTIGQAFAVQALDTDSSDFAPNATAYLLAQQCSEGFFQLTLGATLADTCDTDPDAEGSTDVTGLVMLNLLSQQDNVAVAAALDSAAGWLKDTQAEDGSWGGAAPTTDPNANSTGLAGWALSGLDDPAAAASAEDAAIWLRAHQAEEAAPCVTGLADEVGAIAYDDAALTQARSGGIAAELRDQFRRATAQALPALLAAPAGSTADRSSTTFVRPGATKKIKLNDLAPGQAVCFGGRSIQSLLNADADGSARITVELPNKQATRSYDLGLTDGPIGTVTYKSLKAKTLGLRLKKAKVPAQRKQKVIVKGLSVGESVRVKYDGEVVARGTSRGNHRFTAKFKVGKSIGKQKVRVIGQFGNRNATEKFRVVKGR